MSGGLPAACLTADPASAAMSEQVDLHFFLSHFAVLFPSVTSAHSVGHRLLMQSFHSPHTLYCYRRKASSIYNAPELWTLVASVYASSQAQSPTKYRKNSFDNK